MKPTLSAKRSKSLSKRKLKRLKLVANDWTEWNLKHKGQGRGNGSSVSPQISATQSRIKSSLLADAQSKLSRQTSEFHTKAAGIHRAHGNEQMAKLHDQAASRHIGASVGGFAAGLGGGLAGEQLGQYGGAALGGALGSAVPGVGTAIGAGLGGLAGGALGGLAGRWGAGKVAKHVGGDAAEKAAELGGTVGAIGSTAYAGIKGIKAVGGALKTAKAAQVAKASAQQQARQQAGRAAESVGGHTPGAGRVWDEPGMPPPGSRARTVDPKTGAPVAKSAAPKPTNIKEAADLIRKNPAGHPSHVAGQQFMREEGTRRAAKTATNRAAAHQAFASRFESIPEANRASELIKHTTQHGTSEHTLDLVGKLSKTQKQAYLRHMAGVRNMQRVVRNFNQSQQLQRIVANFSGNIRRTTLNGREYLVAPLTMIVPGILHGSQGPLLYREEDIKQNVAAWNGVPLTVQHPSMNGGPISAKASGVWERQGIGTVKNASYKGKLVAEGWFDAKRTRRISLETYNALVRNQPIELSTGLFTKNLPVKNGAYKGKRYTHIATNFKPDHLAILPDRKGACSIKDGCGVLINKIDPKRARLQAIVKSFTGNHIVKTGKKYRLLSHKGKNLGTFDSHAEAAKHEGEVEYFKAHNNASCPKCGDNLDEKGKCEGCGYQVHNSLQQIVNDWSSWDQAHKGGGTDSDMQYRFGGDGGLEPAHPLASKAFSASEAANAKGTRTAHMTAALAHDAAYKATKNPIHLQQATAHRGIVESLPKSRNLANRTIGTGTGLIKGGIAGAVAGAALSSLKYTKYGKYANLLGKGVSASVGKGRNIGSLLGGAYGALHNSKVKKLKRICTEHSCTVQ